jgi:hypothetical protein
MPNSPPSKEGQGVVVCRAQPIISKKKFPVPFASLRVRSRQENAIVDARSSTAPNPSLKRYELQISHFQAPISENIATASVYVATVTCKDATASVYVATVTCKDATVSVYVATATCKDATVSVYVATATCKDATVTL